MTKNSLIIATRESPLALWQAHGVRSELSKYFPQLKIELLGITTTADKMLDIPLTTVGGKGLFVKELEEALLDHRADIAVHSMKDVPMALPEGLIIPVMCERSDPRDVFVSEHYEFLHQLPKGAILGTSSLRRQGQLSVLRPDIQMASLRGNVNTRLNRLDRGEFDAIILAAAGLKRLDLSGRIRSYLTLEESLPAAGQGVLGIECRYDDEETKKMIQTLHHTTSYLCVLAERAVCTRLGGGCQSPVAAFAEMIGEEMCVRGKVASVDGKRVINAERRGSSKEAEKFGIQVADDLIQQGAGEILCFQG